MTSFPSPSSPTEPEENPHTTLASSPSLLDPNLAGDSDTSSPPSFTNASSETTCPAPVSVDDDVDNDDDKEEDQDQAPDQEEERLGVTTSLPEQPEDSEPDPTDTTPVPVEEGVIPPPPLDPAAAVYAIETQPPEEVAAAAVEKSPPLDLAGKSFPLDPPPPPPPLPRSTPTESRASRATARPQDATTHPPPPPSPRVVGPAPPPPPNEPAPLRRTASSSPVTTRSHPGSFSLASTPLRRTRSSLDRYQDRPHNQGPLRPADDSSDHCSPNGPFRPAPLAPAQDPRQGDTDTVTTKNMDDPNDELPRVPDTGRDRAPVLDPGLVIKSDRLTVHDQVAAYSSLAPPDHEEKKNDEDDPTEAGRGYPLSEKPPATTSTNDTPYQVQMVPTEAVTTLHEENTSTTPYYTVKIIPTDTVMTAAAAATAATVPFPTKAPTSSESDANDMKLNVTSQPVIHSSTGTIRCDDEINENITTNYKLAAIPDSAPATSQVSDHVKSQGGLFAWTFFRRHKEDDDSSAATAKHQNRGQEHPPRFKKKKYQRKSRQGKVKKKVDGSFRSVSDLTVAPILDEEASLPLYSPNPDQTKQSPMVVASSGSKMPTGGFGIVWMSPDGTTRSNNAEIPTQMREVHIKSTSLNAQSPRKSISLPIDPPPQEPLNLRPGRSLEVDIEMAKNNHAAMDKKLVVPLEISPSQSTAIESNEEEDEEAPPVREITARMTTPCCPWLRIWQCHDRRRESWVWAWLGGLLLVAGVIAALTSVRKNS